MRLPPQQYSLAKVEKSYILNAAFFHTLRNVKHKEIVSIIRIKQISTNLFAIGNSIFARILVQKGNFFFFHGKGSIHEQNKTERPKYLFVPICCQAATQCAQGGDQLREKRLSLRAGGIFA